MKLADDMPEWMLAELGYLSWERTSMAARHDSEAL
jgi:hypothetical protein